MNWMTNDNHGCAASVIISVVTRRTDKQEGWEWVESIEKLSFGIFDTRLILFDCCFYVSRWSIEIDVKHHHLPGRDDARWEPVWVWGDHDSEISQLWWCCTCCTCDHHTLHNTLTRQPWISSVTQSYSSFSAAMSPHKEDSSSKISLTDSEQFQRKNHPVQVTAVTEE